MNPSPSRNDKAARPPAAKPAQCSVLLAEDLQDLRTLMAMWLEEADYCVTCVSSGQEVVEHVTRSDFDLLVTDILMPHGDGWDAIAQVRRLRPQMRIIAISGGARQMPANAVLRSARAAGALAALEKPFNRVEFLETVSRVMAAKAR